MCVCVGARGTEGGREQATAAEEPRVRTGETATYLPSTHTRPVYLVFLLTTSTYTHARNTHTHTHTQPVCLPGVLVDHVEHLLVHLLGRHAAAEHHPARQVAVFKCVYVCVCVCVRLVCVCVLSVCVCVRAFRDGVCMRHQHNQGKACMQSTTDTTHPSIHPSIHPYTHMRLSLCVSTSLCRRHKHLKTHRPWRGSAAHIMFLASKACCVSSGTDSARYCCEPRLCVCVFKCVW